MFNFGKIDFQGRLVAMIGALVFSTIFVGAAVGPAQTTEFASVVQVQAPAGVVANV